MWPTILSFAFILAFFLLIGWSASFRRRDTSEDYLIASRQIHPWLVAFAAAATNSSGFMFIGLIGATVKDGLSASWLMVGWMAGDYLAWLAIHRRLRERSAKLKAQSVASFVAGGDQGGARTVRVLCAGLTFLFLGTYAAAQFTAGSKGLQVLLDWPRSAGILIGAGLLMLYCFTGGLRASIWVNTAQAFVMLGSVMMLLVTALIQIGGLGELWSQLEALDPKYVDWRPQNAHFGFIAFLAGWIAAGAGVIGQPHLMTIAMTIESGSSMYRARRVYFVWIGLFYTACILVGLCCRVLLNSSIDAGFDPEMSMPRLAGELLPAILVGVILAALFSATLSTADTQIICSSAALTQDLFPSWGRSYGGTKLGMAATATVVVLTALFETASVFELVLLSWSCLASAIGPALAVRALGWPLNNRIGSAMILGGLGAALAWRYGLRWSSSIYEGLPGMLAGFAIYGAARLAGQPPDDPIPSA